jgi:hypothetical protein
MYANLLVLLRKFRLPNFLCEILILPFADKVDLRYEGSDLCSEGDGLEFRPGH